MKWLERQIPKLAQEFENAIYGDTFDFLDSLEEFPFPGDLLLRKPYFVSLLDEAIKFCKNAKNGNFNDDPDMACQTSLGLADSIAEVLLYDPEFFPFAKELIPPQFQKSIDGQRACQP